jgi:hypothetical protein
MLRGKDTHCIFRESNKGTMCGIYQNERAIGYGIHRKSKKGDRQFNGKEIIIYITLHRKLKIEQHEPH